MEAQENTNNPKLIYILFIAQVVIPFLGLIGVIMAYVNKADAPEWIQSHYQFQIRTFWIGFLYMFIGALLSIVIIGWFVILFAVVWMIVRCIKGMKSLDAHEAHPNPTGWMFS